MLKIGPEPSDVCSGRRDQRMAGELPGVLSGSRNLERIERMGIAIRLEDEHGNVLETLDWPNWLDHLLPAYEDESFQCLRFVDPYGDTVFNRVQMPTFISELERVQQQADSDRERGRLVEVGRLAERCLREVHLYVRFFGD